MTKTDRKTQKKYQQRPEVKERHRIAERKRSQRQEVKAKRKAYEQRPEVRERINKNQVIWRQKNPEKSRRQSRESRNRTRPTTKNKVFSYYSDGKLNCKCCGISGIEFLTVDHIIPRKKMQEDIELVKRGYSADLNGKDLYRWLMNSDFPDGFQILCWNCNFAKGRLGKCPHLK
jgi:5-methylcytosine-specific restriction endonuclease McrA